MPWPEDHMSHADTPMPATPKLSNRRNRFALEYTRDLNPRAAAVRAGFAESTAYQLMRDAKVLQSITDAFARRAERTNISVDRVVTELARVAFANIKDIVEWGNGCVTLLDSDAIDADAAAAIAEVVQSDKDKGKVKVRLHSKMEALNALGRHLGMFIERTETVSLNLDAPVYRQMSLEEIDRRLADMRALEGGGDGLVASDSCEGGVP